MNNFSNDDDYGEKLLLQLTQARQEIQRQENDDDGEEIPPLTEEQQAFERQEIDAYWNADPRERKRMDSKATGKKYWEEEKRKRIKEEERERIREERKWERERREIERELDDDED